MVCLRITGHIDNATILPRGIRKLEPRSRLVEHEIRKGRMVPKHSVSLEIEHCMEFANNQVSLLYHVGVVGEKLSSDRGRHTLLGTKKRVEDLQAILQQVIAESTKSSREDLLIQAVDE